MMEAYHFRLGHFEYQDLRLPATESPLSRQKISKVAEQQEYGSHFDDYRVINPANSAKVSNLTCLQSQAQYHSAELERCQACANADSYDGFEDSLGTL